MHITKETRHASNNHHNFIDLHTDNYAGIYEFRTTHHQTQHPETRLALVIGNSAYKNSPLRNPVNDAKDMTEVLKKLGFTVTKLINASQSKMRKEIRKFGYDLKKGGVGLFFYAGHGMQINGVNYLIPIGVDIYEENEVQDFAVDAGMILRKMQSAKNRTNIVILDACRNNPFARSFRSSQKGLAQIDAPSDIMIYDLLCNRTRKACCRWP